jgi:uncharacterized protein (DUF58 family)
MLAQSRFLDLRAMASLEHMRFTTGHRMEGAYSGRHPSRQQGGAGEFVDFREYVEGEDLRQIDWKVLGRTGRAYVRLFQDETNLLCTLLLDASASMWFGARSSRDGRGSKLEYAQYLSTALSYLIARQQDAVGLAVVADGLKEVLQPAAASTHMARVHEAIEAVQTRPATDLGRGLRELYTRLARRGVLLMMSDFLVDDLDPVFAGIRLFRHRRWDVVILHLIHPQEETLPEGRAFRFVGLEGEGQVATSPGEIRRLYRQRFENHAAAVRTSALASGCQYLRVSTSIPYLQTLGKFLVERTG